MRGRVIFVIGVSGCGKTTIAGGLAEQLVATFLEGDSFHPPRNVEWMRSGHPLTDEMRWGWLEALGQATRTEAEAGRDVVTACSGLKKSYRDLLRKVAGPCRFVFLDGSPELIRARMLKRVDHYMPATLLDSQFATLEPPGADEPDVAHLEISDRPEVLIVAAAKLIQ